LACAGMAQGVPHFVVALVHCVAVSAGPSIHKMENNGVMATGTSR
jgi:hypothetical protein